MINETTSSTNALNAMFSNPKNAIKDDSEGGFEKAMKTSENKTAPKDLQANKTDNKDNTVRDVKHYKVEKPKVNARDDFFPSPTMPYHPDLRNDMARPQETDEGQDEDFIRAIANREQSMDDTDGVMKKAIAKSVVSYPVKQVASESLDDGVKQALMAQGLWDMQGQYYAKPTPQFQAMVVPVQKPIAQFMASMENELGVSSDRLVQVYGEMSSESLKQSPQQTMKEVIQNLGLSKGDEKKAEALYVKMLTQLQAQDAVSNPAEDEARNLLAKAVLEKAVEKYAAKTERNPTEHQKAEPMMMEPDSFQNQLQAQNLPQDQMKSDVKQDHFLNTFVEGKGSQHSPIAAKNPQNGFEQNLANENHKHGNAQGDILNLKSAEATNNQSASQIQGHSSKNFDSQLQAVQPGMSLTEAQLAQAGDGRAARHEAIQNIINNAQALSQKGGGEMRMTLKPEHLGEIQLKVSVVSSGQGNQVNVQMVAEKPEAKKLLEQNIQELKHGLASHNLSMEKLDVSVSDRNTGTFQHHGKPDFNQAREFAQQQFQNRHNQNSDAQKYNDYRSGRMTTRTMLPTVAENPATKVRAFREGKLNVVA